MKQIQKILFIMFLSQFQMTDSSVGRAWNLDDHTYHKTPLTYEDEIAAAKEELQDPLELLQNELENKEIHSKEPLGIKMGPMGIETGSIYYKDTASTETQAVYREDCVAFSIESRDQLQCDMCRKSFSDAALLAVHRWIHSSSSSKAV